MKAHHFYLLFFVIFGATLGALLTWTLIVKQQVQASASSSPLVNLLSNL